MADAQKQRVKKDAVDPISNKIKNDTMLFIPSAIPSS